MHETFLSGSWTQEKNWRRRTSSSSRRREGMAYSSPGRPCSGKGQWTISSARRRGVKGSCSPLAAGTLPAAAPSAEPRCWTCYTRPEGPTDTLLCLGVRSRVYARAATRKAGPGSAFNDSLSTPQTGGPQAGKTWLNKRVSHKSRFTYYSSIASSSTE